jgi:hypothetical protein
VRIGMAFVPVGPEVVGGLIGEGREAGAEGVRGVGVRE